MTKKLFFINFYLIIKNTNTLKAIKSKTAPIYGKNLNLYSVTAITITGAKITSPITT